MEELGRALEQEQRLSRELDDQSAHVANSERALAADATARTEKQGVIAAGEKAENTLTLLLRRRLSDEVSARSLPPVWFQTVLGSVPPAAGTGAWLETATGVLLYRLVYSVTDPVVALGEKPATRTGHRATWFKKLSEGLQSW